MNGAASGGAISDVDGASVLDQAADRDSGDVAGCRKRLSQGEADVDQRRPAQARDIRNRSPDRLGDFTVRLRPKPAVGNTNLLKFSPLFASSGRGFPSTFRRQA
ncbi:hypothetical protein GCM10022207_91570 [Streptomyces lannensis]|uniref:Uncharacterized protein n=1 Tax=Streptomyces lannensis TaxID=766498 RepID=A0ABP7LWV5_9ACTN